MDNFEEVSGTGNTKKLSDLDPDRDDKGRLLKFADLLKVHQDLKGWIAIPNTNIEGENNWYTLLK